MHTSSRIPRYAGDRHNFDTAAASYAGRPDYPEDFYHELGSRLQDHQDGLMVDLGCGDARLAARAGRWGWRVLALDLSAPMLAAASQRLAEPAGSRVYLVQAHAEQLPLPSRKADALIIGQAFHWMRRRPVAQEVARVLKPHGLWVVLWVEPQRPLSPAALVADELIAAAVPSYNPKAARELGAKNKIPARLGFQVDTWRIEFTRTYSLEEYVRMTVSKSYVASALSGARLGRFEDALLARLRQAGSGARVAELYLLTAHLARLQEV